MIKEWIHTFYNLFFPHFCIACARELPSVEVRFFCYECLSSLPETHFDQTFNNPVYTELSKHVSLQKATSFYLFQKHSGLRKAIHLFKYERQADLAVFLGARMAEGLLLKGFFEGIDYLVPVPLHDAKQALRTYNQAEKIAQGVSSKTHIPLLPSKVFIRNKNTRKQASLKAFEDRRQNLQNAFLLTEPDILCQKHILLIDDVFTSGATMLACIKAIHKDSPSTHISVLTLAFATL